MKRNFGLKLHKHGFWHRANPFNAMMKVRLRNTLGVATATKTLFTSPVLDQGPTMTCAEHEACAEQAAIDGIAYDVQQFLAAVCGFLNILPSQYNGTDMKTVMAAAINPGLTPVGQTKPTVQASAVMWITPENGMDLYDTLQTYIDLYQRPLGFGVMWMNDWEGGQNGVVPSSLPESSLGSHCTMWCGKVRSGEFLGVTFPEPDRMLNQNSWGVNAPGSARGYYLFPRNIVNMYTGSYGCAVKVFSTDATVILLGKLSMLYVKVIDLIASMGNKKTSPVVPVDPDAGPLVWTDPVSARHAIRVTCDLNGLLGKTLDGYPMKDVLCACVQAESAFNPQAVHHNKDKTGAVWSSDWGIAQINDWFNIGPGKPFPSVQYVLDNPQACVEWMCNQFLAGNAHLWSSYSQGLYKKYL